jgi:hypothetical protein
MPPTTEQEVELSYLRVEHDACQAPDLANSKESSRNRSMPAGVSPHDGLWRSDRPTPESVGTSADAAPSDTSGHPSQRFPYNAATMQTFLCK